MESVQGNETRRAAAMVHWFQRGTLVVGTILLGIVTGCGPVAMKDGENVPGNSPADPQKSGVAVLPTAAESAPHEEDHHHEPGLHGGIIISIGADSYHAEAIVEKSGGLRLLMLDQDETRIKEVDAQRITAYVRLAGQPDAISVVLAPAPQDGDQEGKTSQFIGPLPADMVGQEIDVTIPNLRIDGERFRVAFSSRTQNAESRSHDEAMPTGAKEDERRELYLTAAGLYTAEDIAANGNQTAQEKFKGVMSAHDMHPKPGDRICPITKTKANPKFTWIIDGKSYQFCCPPCVDEYVRLAKEEPELLQEPDKWIQQ